MEREEKRLTPRFVREGIAQARRLAEDRGVPLTLERVAACLGIGRERLRELAAAAGRTRAERETAALLRQVYQTATRRLLRS